jgi:hypothetical protein
MLAADRSVPNTYAPRWDLLAFLSDPTSELNYRVRPLSSLELAFAAPACEPG